LRAFSIPAFMLSVKFSTRGTKIVERLLRGLSVLSGLNGLFGLVGLNGLFGFVGLNGLFGLLGFNGLAVEKGFRESSGFEVMVAEDEVADGELSASGALPKWMRFWPTFEAFN
jgi:hypothetical protein